MKEPTHTEPPTFPPSLASLRGQQQRSLRAALQGFTGRRLVRKLHDAPPGGAAAVVRHHNRPLHWPKLGECLMEDGHRKSRRMQEVERTKTSRRLRFRHLFQQLIGDRGQEVTHSEHSAVGSKADPHWSIVQNGPIQLSFRNLCQRPGFLGDK